MTALSSQVRSLPLTSAAPVLTSRQLYRIAGVLFASIVPALFWMMMASGVAHIAGIHLTTTVLTTTGCAIAAFLGYVCAPIMLRAQ